MIHNTSSNSDPERSFANSTRPEKIVEQALYDVINGTTEFSDAYFPEGYSYARPKI